jgi:ketosteroid isomerase-like protein
MSEKNLEIVRRAIKAFNGEDLDQALEWADPEIEWVVAREHPDAATHRGRDAVAAYLREWQDTLEDLRLEMARVVEVGDTVVTVGKMCGVGAGSGAAVEIPIAFVSYVREGRTVRVEEYLNQAHALRAVGLSQMDDV